MTNYQVTVGYRAILTIDVKAETEKEAKEIAMDKMKTVQVKIGGTKGVTLQDDNFKPDGILDMDSTYNYYDKR